MKVNLDINNRDKTIEFHYKHTKGSITIKYIDDETGKIIKTEILPNLDLGEHEIIPKHIEGYEVVNEYEVIEEEIEKEEEIDFKEDIDKEVEEEIDESKDDRIKSIKDFINLMESEE